MARERLHEVREGAVHDTEDTRLLLQGVDVIGLRHRDEMDGRERGDDLGRARSVGNAEAIPADSLALKSVVNHIIVRPDGFDAQETSCEVNKIERKGAAWLASFRCSGAGLTWLEDDEIRVRKDGWTLEAKIKHARRVGDPVRYCLANKC